MLQNLNIGSEKKFVAFSAPITNNLRNTGRSDTTKRSSKRRQFERYFACLNIKICAVVGKLFAFKNERKLFAFKKESYLRLKMEKRKEKMRYILQYY